MPTTSRTGYPNVFQYQGRYGIKISRKGRQIRKDGLPTLYDAVKLLNVVSGTEHELPPDPYREVLAPFLRQHKAPGEKTEFRRVLEALREPWEAVAKAPLTPHLLSKLLRERGYPTYRSGSFTKIRGLLL